MRFLEVFAVFLRLGFTCFGGPIAHIAHFHSTFVQKKKWISETEFAELVALCQVLPGPASSQVAMGIGLRYAGYAGSTLALIGFILPSATLMILLALYGNVFTLPSLTHALKLSVVPVVGQAVWLMASQNWKGWRQWLIGIITVAALLFVPDTRTVLVVLVAGIVGTLCLEVPVKAEAIQKRSIFFPLFALGAFGLALLLTFAANRQWAEPALIFARFFEVGSMVFGGGHVVLPELKAATVDSGWITKDLFYQGYAFAQMMPGPLFSFAGYVGAASRMALGGWQSGVLCLLAIYLPSFFLLWGMLPLWEQAKTIAWFRGARAGINCAMVGFLLSAFVRPIFMESVGSLADGILVLAVLALMIYKSLPAWSVVLAFALLGMAHFL